MYSAETIETAAGCCIVRRSERRTLAISVLPDGTVELAASHDAETAAIRSKVSRKLRWIATQQRNFAEMNRHRAPRLYVSGATHRYLGRQYRLKINLSRITSVTLAGGYFQVRAKTGEPREVRILLAAWSRTKAKAQFTTRLNRWDDWCIERRLPKPTLRLLTMPKRWGSAQRGGIICLNPDLVKTPSVCIDYVIAHEICHLLHPYHNRPFFALLDQLFPTWKSVKARLEAVEI